MHLKRHAKRTRLSLRPLMLIFAGYTAYSAPAPENVNADDDLRYAVSYTVAPNPALQTVDVTMRVRQKDHLLRELRFATNSRISGFSGDGEIDANARQVTWLPGERGGTLRWSVKVVHRRNSNGYDAWLTDDWGLFRAEDIIPRAATRAVRNAFSTTRIKFELPQQWSVVTAYAGTQNTFSVDNAKRRFDQPVGWIVMGPLGVRREIIGTVRVAVAGPVEHTIRRIDMLALLNWTLPELNRLLPSLPTRLTIVSAADPMWRGGLSAPGSLFIHAERPLISENATSTLLHEVMHSLLQLRAVEGYDWIVEGFAEYYSLELLRRSATISQNRYDAALRSLAEWARSADVLCRRSSTGPVTALAVTLLSRLNTEIRERTDNQRSLDDLLRMVHRQDRPADLELLALFVEQLTGRRSDALDRKNLPGCAKFLSGQGEPD